MEKTDFRELVIIDGNIVDVESILADLKENQMYIILSGGNGFTPLMEYLEKSGSGWSAFHFITHGTDAAFALNGTTVSMDHLCSADWSKLGEYLTEGGDILLYGCNIAASDAGKALVDAIAGLTGADVAASVDITGVGGNNVLEYRSGDIGTASTLPQSFGGVLEGGDTNRYEIGAGTNSNFEYKWFSGDGDYKNVLGGAIYVANGGEVTVDSSTFTGKWVRGNNVTAGGGAIYNCGKAYVYQSTFSGNSVDTIVYPSGGTCGNGGAVFNVGFLSVEESIFSANNTYEGGRGGAVYNTGTFTASVNVSFNKNIASSDGGAVFNSNSFTVSESTFEANTAASGNGGAVYNSGIFTVENGSRFVSNWARSSFGGAVYNAGSFTATATATEEGSTFSSNSASKSGGAVYNADGYDFVIHYGTFSSNKADKSGGAIYNGATLTVGTTSKVATAEVLYSRFSGNNGATSGGAVYNAGKFTAKDVTFENNSAAKGGAVYNDGAEAFFSILGGEFKDNRSGSAASDVYNAGGTFSARSVSFSRSSVVDKVASIENTNGGVLNIEESSFTGYNSEVGVIHNSGTGSAVTLKSTTFSNNKLTYSTAAITNTEGGNVTVSNSVFDSNSTTNASYGGAIYNGTNSTVTITDTSFLTGSDGIYNDGEMILGGTITFSGPVNAIGAGNGTVQTEDLTSIIFDVDKLGPDSEGVGFAGIDKIEYGYSSTFTFDVSGIFKDKDTLQVGTYKIASLTSADGSEDIRFNFKFDTSDTVTLGIGDSRYGGTYSQQECSLSLDGKVINFNVAILDTAIVTGEGKDNSVTIGEDTYKGSPNKASDFFTILDLDSFETVVAQNFKIGDNRFDLVPNERTIIENDKTLIADRIDFGNRTSPELGGAVNNAGTFSAYNSTVSGNTSTANGGGVYNSGIFSANTVMFSRDAAASGGAVYNAIGSTFTANVSTFELNTVEGDGGAVYNTGTFTADNSLFSTNKALYDDVDKVLYGGAVHNAASASAEITDSTFSGNIAVNGGAISNFGTLTFKDSEFKENNATAPDALTEKLPEGTAIKIGGAVYNTGNLIAEASDFNNNVASEDGGAVYNVGVSTVSSSQFSGNTAENGKGGAVYNAAGTFTADGDTFDKNYAQEVGGAVYIEGGTFIATNNSTFKENSVVGPSPFIIQALVGDGGAVYNAADGIASISESTFLSNTALAGGAVYNEGKFTAESDDDIFEKNYAIEVSGYEHNPKSGNGGAVYNTGIFTFSGGGNGKFLANTASKSGGAVYNAGSFVASASTFSGNKANDEGGAVYNTGTFTGGSLFSTNTSENGGAVYNTGTFTSDGKFIENTATENGGAVYNTGTFSLTNGGTFSENTAAGKGGAVYNESGIFSADESKFNDNVATENGGAVYNIDTFIAKSGTFSRNRGVSGAAVYNIGVSTVTGSTFEANTAAITDETLELDASTVAENGGALYNAGSFTASNSSFNDNGASDFGGAVYNEGNFTSFRTSSYEHAAFNRNWAKVGGAVYNTGKFEVTGNAFDSNTASENGGAAYNTGSLIAIGSTFSNNTAVCGAALYNEEIGTISILSDAEDGCSTLFSGNTVSDFGGAVYNAGQVQLTRKDGSYFLVVTGCFESNRAKAGGAIYNTGMFTSTATDDKRLEFNSNSAAEDGGAIYNTGTLVIGGEDGSDSAIFNGNSATGSGGAFYNAESGIATISSSTFSGNIADMYGGAVYNAGEMTIEDSVFTTQSDTIWNDGVITLKGTVTFSGNLNVTGRAADSDTLGTGVIHAEDAVIAVNLTDIAPENTLAVITDIDGIINNDATKYELSINRLKGYQEGQYKIASGAYDFNKSFYIGNAELVMNGPAVTRDVYKEIFNDEGKKTGEEFVKTLRYHVYKESNGDICLSVTNDGNKSTGIVTEDKRIEVTIDGETYQAGVVYFPENLVAALCCDEVVVAQGPEPDSESSFDVDSAVQVLQDHIFVAERVNFNGTIAEKGEYGLSNNNGGTFKLHNGTFNVTDVSKEDVIPGGALFNAATATAELDNVSFMSQDDKINNNGNMVLKGTISLAGNFNVKGNEGTGTCTVSADGACIVFDLSGYTKGNKEGIITNLDAITGDNKTFAIKVNANQKHATYILAEDAKKTSIGNVTLSNGISDEVTLSVGDSQTLDDVKYTLNKETNGKLSLTVSDMDFGVFGRVKASETRQKKLGYLVTGMKIGKGQEYEGIEVYQKGKVENIAVQYGGVLNVNKLGKARTVTVNEGSVMVAFGGSAIGINVLSGTATINGEVSDFSIQKGTASIQSKGVVENLTATDNAKLEFGDGSRVETLSLAVTKGQHGSSDMLDAAYLKKNDFTGTDIFITIDKTLMNNPEYADTLIQNLVLPGNIAVNGSNVDLMKTESDGWIWTDDLAFQIQIKPGDELQGNTLSVRGDGVTQFKNGNFDISKDVNAASRDFDNIASFTIRKGKVILGKQKSTTFTAHDLQTAEGTTKITMQDYTILNLNGLRKDPNAGGAHIITAGKYTEISIGNEKEEIENVLNGLQKFSVGDFSLVTIHDDITCQTGNNSISLGKNMLDDTQKDKDGNPTAGAKFADIDMKTGKNTFTVGSNSIVATENLTNVTTLKLANGSAVALDQQNPNVKTQRNTEMTVNGIYTPSLQASTAINIGKFASLTITGGTVNGKKYAVYNEDISVAASTKITVGSNSKFTANGILSGISSLTLSAGTAYLEKNTQNAKVQGTTEVNLSSNAPGIMPKYYELYGTAQNNTIKLNAFTKLAAAGINLYGGNNTISVAAKAEMTIVKNMVSVPSGIANVKTISLGAGGNYYADLNKNAEPGTYRLAQATMKVSGGIILSAMADSISIGKFAVFSTGFDNISTKDGAGTIKLTIGSNAEFTSGNLSEIVSLSIANTVDYVNKNDGKKEIGHNKFDVKNITATDANNTFSFGNSVTADIQGDVDFRAGKDSLKTGKLSKVKIDGNVKFGVGTAQDNGTLAIGSQADFTAGDVTGLTKLVTAAGDSKTGIYTHAEVGSLSGTTGNDTISLGKYSELAVQGSLDMRDALAQDKITVADNANLSIAGDIKNRDTLAITLGKGAKLGLNSEMFAKQDTLNVTHAKDGSDAIYDIGSGEVAKAFRGFTLEESDNLVEGKPGEGYTVLGKEDNGWLCSKGSTSPTATSQYYEDTSDCIKFDVDYLHGFEITGSRIKVSAFKQDQQGGAWNEVVEGIVQDGNVWKMEDASVLSEANDYRVVVEFNASGMMGASGAVNYTISVLE